LNAAPPRRGAVPTGRAVLAVACSGGRDSTALLHAVSQAARGHALEVVALHVHHGLMAQADAWAERVQALARRCRVRCVVHRLAGRPARGDSVEAWARRERYAALADMARAQGADTVLLAQHRRDQAETVLLQLLRGAGPAGLAAMPRVAQRDGITWLRPWRDLPREAIEVYVRRHRLPVVEDGSNADPRFARARLRTGVWPALSAAFGNAEAALASAAERAQEAAAVLAEVAASDLAEISDGDALDVAAWLRFSPARRMNALRAWLAPRLPAGAPQALLQRLADELPTARSARWPCGQGIACRLYRGRLHLRADDAGAADGPPQVLDLRRVGRHAVPGWSGSFVVDRVSQGGVPTEALRTATIRAREGGERFRLAADGMARSLKKQYQARGVPLESRRGPLVLAGDRMLFAPGLGLDAAACAMAGRARRRIRWEPAA
jgi:tRNA(Ile)-lysidine synthase